MSYKLTNLSYEQLKDILERMNENNKYYCFSCNSYFDKVLYVENESNIPINLCPNCYERDDYNCKFDFEVRKNVVKYQMNVCYGNFVNKPKRKYIPFSERIANKNTREVMKKVKVYDKKSSRFTKIKKIIIFEIGFFICLITFPFSLIGIGFLIFNHYKKNYVKKNYPKSYEMRYRF